MSYLASPSVDFSMTSPLLLLAPPLLLCVSIPLCILAVLTTTLAVALLAVRVLIVYCELGVALVHAYLFPQPSKPPPRPPKPRRFNSSPTRQRRLHRRRRSSHAATSNASQDTVITPAQPPRTLHSKNRSFASLVGTSEITRDFEGVGGWRVPGNEDEEALWMGMNSRLELPAIAPKRHHQRSLTGGSGSQRYSWSPGALRMSPVQSRARTPTQPTSGDGHGGSSYFPPQTHGEVRPLSTASDPTGKVWSPSGSTSSSTASSTGTSMADKQPGE